MKMFSIPNILTLGNLLCGCLCIVSILYLSSEAPYYILIFFMASQVLDFLDGLAARALQSYSPIGAQLDSLADVVSFGFVPGFMISSLIFDSYYTDLNFDVYEVFMLFVLGFMVTLFSALRLAKFNIDTEQKDYFKGLPVPANALLIFSLFWLERIDHSISLPFWFLLIIVAFSCFMLVSNIPLFSLKFRKFQWKGNELPICFVLAALIAFAIFQMIAVPFIIISYIIISLIFRKKIIAHAST